MKRKWNTRSRHESPPSRNSCPLKDHIVQFTQWKGQWPKSNWGRGNSTTDGAIWRHLPLLSTLSRVPCPRTRLDWWPPGLLRDTGLKGRRRRKEIFEWGNGREERKREVNITKSESLLTLELSKHNLSEQRILAVEHVLLVLDGWHNWGRRDRSHFQKIRESGHLEQHWSWRYLLLECWSWFRWSRDEGSWDWSGLDWLLLDDWLLDCRLFLLECRTPFRCGLHVDLHLILLLRLFFQLGEWLLGQLHNGVHDVVSWQKSGLSSGEQLLSRQTAWKTSESQIKRRVFSSEREALWWGLRPLRRHFESLPGELLLMSDGTSGETAMRGTVSIDVSLARTSWCCASEDSVLAQGEHWKRRGYFVKSPRKVAFLNGKYEATPNKSLLSHYFFQTQVWNAWRSFVKCSRLAARVRCARWLTLNDGLVRSARASGEASMMGVEAGLVAGSVASWGRTRQFSFWKLGLRIGFVCVEVRCEWFGVFEDVLVKVLGGISRFQLRVLPPDSKRKNETPFILLSGRDYSRGANLMELETEKCD